MKDIEQKKTDIYAASRDVPLAMYTCCVQTDAVLVVVLNLDQNENQKLSDN